MTITKTLVAAATATMITSSAFAGGLADTITPPIETIRPSTSVPAWVIPALIVGALIAVASQSDTTTTGGTSSGG